MGFVELELFPGSIEVVVGLVVDVLNQIDIWFIVMLAPSRQGKVTV